MKSRSPQLVRSPRWSALPVFVALLCGLAGWALQAAEVSSVVTLADESEPGERMVLRGRVLTADGETPVAGAEVYAFQTDARGWYSKERWDAEDRPRLSAVARTDGAGRFEFRTIRPGPYPIGGAPAHIHFKVTADGYPRQKHQIVYFEGDPYLDEAQRKSFDPSDRLAEVRPLSRDEDGVWICEKDLRLVGGEG